MALVEVRDLVKVYPGDVRAVDGISFDVAAGEVFGFLGPNGAGKTTTIRILVTLLDATAGEARVDGLDVAADAEAVRRRVGYAAQFIAVDDDLTATENLVLQGRLHGVAAREAKVRADHLLEVFQLTDVAGRRVGTFSGGMRRRLDLAQALVHHPTLIFLDEPTTGLDPQTRRALWDYLRRLNDDGVTIFLTTQYMEEADALASRLAIVDQGGIVVRGSPADLKSGLGGDAVTLTLAPGVDGETGRVAAATLAGMGATDVGVEGSMVHGYLADGGSRLVEVVRALDAAGVSLARVEMDEPSLDEVFLRHTGGRMRVEEVKPRSRTLLSRRRRR